MFFPYLIPPSRSCRENSRSVAYTRNISKERLEKSYKDVKKYWRDENTPNGGYILYSENTYMPKEFVDINEGIICPKEDETLFEGYTSISGAVA